MKARVLEVELCVCVYFVLRFAGVGELNSLFLLPGPSPSPGILSTPLPDELSFGADKVQGTVATLFGGLPRQADSGNHARESTRRLAGRPGELRGLLGLAWLVTRTCSRL